MEKAARAARKRALVDMNAHETQEGVMDSLMEALQTGSAFSRPDQRRKRQTRVAGGKFYRTYIWRRIAKRDQAAQSFTNTLSTKLMYEYENVTPTETVRRDIISNRIMTKLCTTDDSSFFTPEENQELYKRMLLDEAKKTPKQIKRSSRVTFFQKKRQCSRCNLPFYTAMPVFDETPKRDILLKTVTNFESRCINTDWELSPLVDENASLKRAHIISPVKQRRVVINKIRKRNSIVRRAILNRKRIHASNKNAKRCRLRNSLQSPPNMSSTMPLVMNSSIISSNSIKSAKMSRTIDGLHTKILKAAYTPIKLLRSKNFENLTRHNETQNILDMKNKSLNSSISTQFSSTDQIINAQSPLLIEMSGITLLSENSPLHLIKPNSIYTEKNNLNISGKMFGKLTNTYEPFVLKASSPNAKNNYHKMKKPKDRLWKKKWKFWQASNISTI